MSKICLVNSKIMLNDFNFNCPAHIAFDYTDMLSGIDDLSNIVKENFKLNPFKKALFLFCSKRLNKSFLL